MASYGVYKERALELQPTLYSASGGLVQSFVFAHLLGILLTRGAKNAFSFDTVPDQVFWVRFITAFLVIVLVWHEYAYGLIYFRWEWGLSDSFLPFLMGIAQYYLNLNVLRSQDSGTTMSQWYWAMFWVTLLGLLSYWNQWLKAGQHPVSRTAFDVVSRERGMGIVGSIALVCLFGYLGNATEGVQHTSKEKLERVLYVLAIVVGMIAVSASTRYKLRIRLP